MEHETCPGCGLDLERIEGPSHPHIGASASCWALYGEVLAREYGDPKWGRVHQMTVDTYAVQHPGVPERRSIRSVGLHLITLCLMLEDRADPQTGPKLHQRLAGRAFRWLQPPFPNGRLTVADVLEARNAVEHVGLVEAWARDVWAAWTSHHATVREWIKLELGEGDRRTMRSDRTSLRRRR